MAGGILNRRRYKALYALGTNLLPGTADALAKWVSSGGVLFYEGSPFQDHLNRPLRTLEGVFGAKSGDVSYEPGYTHVYEIVRHPALDSVVPETAVAAGMPKAGYDSVYLRVPLRPTTARVLSRFRKDGAPALTVNRYGSGTAILSGSLLGCAYMRQSLPESAWPAYQKLYAVYFPHESSVRGLINLPLKTARIQPDAWTSEPIVETNTLTLKDGLLVLLSDYTKTQKTVDLFIRVNGRVKSVRTLKEEVSKWTVDAGVLHLTVPIDLTQAVRVYLD